MTSRVPSRTSSHSLIEAENGQNTNVKRRNGITASDTNLIPSHHYYTRYSARFAQNCNPEVAALIRFRDLISSSEVFDDSDTESTRLESHSASPSPLRSGTMSLRFGPGSTHLDPCSEPNVAGIAGNGFLAKVGIAAAIICFTAVTFTALNAKPTIVKIDDNGVLMGELEHIKESIMQVREHMQNAIKAKQNAGEMVDEVNKILNDVKKVSAECHNPAHEEAAAVRLYDDDKTGKADFALETAGASIVTTRSTDNFQRGILITLFGWTLCQTNKGARYIIQPSVALGECWAFKGKGQVVIKLLDSIQITGVTLEHISKNVSPDGNITAAPKDFVVIGLISPNTHGDFLGKFQFNINAPPVQYFPIPNEIGRRPYPYVELRFLNNHGHPQFTCVYRVRIHGTARPLVDSEKTPADDDEMDVESSNPRL